MNRNLSAESARPLLFRGSAQSLGVARFAIYAIWFVSVCRTDLPALSILPSDRYDPVGICRLFGEGLADHFSPQVFLAFKLFLLAITAVLALGIRPFTPVAAVGALAILLFDSLLKSYASFVNHAQVGMLYAAMAMVFFPASDAFALFRFRPVKRPAPAVYRAAMAFPAFAFTLAYSFVGIRRLALGPEVLWNDSLAGWIVTRTLQPLRYGFTWGLSAAASDPMLFLMKVGFAVITLFEILSPWAVFSDRFRRLWLLVIIPFHVSTLVGMNIFFWENLLFILIWFTGLSYEVIPGFIASRSWRWFRESEAEDVQKS